MHLSLLPYKNLLLSINLQLVFLALMGKTCIALGWMLDAVAGSTVGLASPQMLELQGGLCPKQTLLQLHQQSTRHQLACVQG